MALKLGSGGQPVAEAGSRAESGPYIESSEGRTVYLEKLSTSVPAIETDPDPDPVRSRLTTTDVGLLLLAVYCA